MLFVRWGYVPAFKPKSWQSLPVSDYENYKEVSVLNIDYLAEDMNMKPEALIRESVETFLMRKLKIIESELFLLAKKYGVSSVVEFDEMVKKGKLHEEDSFEDYFKFDDLETKRDRILIYLKKL